VARTISFSRARAQLTRILDELGAGHEHFVITRNGKPGRLTPWKKVKRDLINV
jgi:PHD/YefM family antitoxin component YafN of YafNO toxin-antitoxin module